MDERAAHVSHALGLDLDGLVLDGRYQIGQRVGAGGMAAVYEGRRLGLERRVAIKILRPELAENESNVRRFLREAKAASSIQHPNIVSIEDVGGQSRPVYFVMEYLDGVDLRHELRRVGRFDWPRTHDLAQQVISALSAAHQMGIVHRDVKPANCFLVRDPDGYERIKVLDFGIAKVLEESQEFTANVTATHGIVGTVAYMAPEQARSGTVDARTDVYALGTMLYEMLAGCVPFPDKNPFVVIGRLLGETPVPLRMHRPDLSTELEAIVMTCLEKDPNARFQSMDALGAALASCDRDDVVVGTAKVRLPSGLLRSATMKPSAPLSLPPKTDPPPPRPAPTVPLAKTPMRGAPAARTDAPASATPASARSSGPNDTALVSAPGSRPSPVPVAAAARPSSVPSVAAVARPSSTRSNAGSSTTMTIPGRSTAWLGVVVGGIGMLALGGTATWWALHGRHRSDADTLPATIAPASEPTTAPTAVPAPPTTVFVPIATPSPPATLPGTTDAATPPPAVAADPAPTVDAKGRKRPRGSEVTTTTPATTTTTTPTTTTTVPATTTTPPATTTDGGRDPRISPDLRNPFGRPKG